MDGRTPFHLLPALKCAFLNFLPINQCKPEGNSKHHQNVIICSAAHWQHFLHFSAKSVHNFILNSYFVSYSVLYFTNNQTNVDLWSTTQPTTRGRSHRFCSPLHQFTCVLLHTSRFFSLGRKKKKNMFSCSFITEPDMCQTDTETSMFAYINASIKLKLQSRIMRCKT